MSSSFDVTRNDDGDYFMWYGNNNITCEDFSSHTAYYESTLNSSHCRCNNDSLTFSTDSSTCKEFADQGLVASYVTVVIVTCSISTSNVHAVKPACIMIIAMYSLGPLSHKANIY